MTEHNEPSLGPPREVSTSPPLDDRFWQATPAVGNHVVWERVGSGIAMWGVGTSFTINMVGSALVEHMDGSASLRELAEDLAMAGDIPEPTARHVVATLVHELTTRHALDDAPTRPAGISRSLGGDRTMGGFHLGGEHFRCRLVDLVGKVLLAVDMPIHHHDEHDHGPDEGDADPGPFLPGDRLLPPQPL